MSWTATYSDRARKDLRGIYEYIAYDLLTPDTASGQTGRIMKEIRSLEEMPLRYQLYEDEPWHSQGLRFFPVGTTLCYICPMRSNTRSQLSASCMAAAM